MKNRSHLEIIATILETVGENGAIQSKIMYKVYLSFIQMKEYLSQIMKKDLLIYDHEEQVYKITSKGRQFLLLYRKMNESVTMTKPI
jgi:predicted transcriptional regulator